MYRQITYIATLLFCAWTAVACSDLIQEQGGEATKNSNQNWLSLRISLPMDLSTRAGVQDATNNGTYVGTADEQKVTSVRVVLYDAEGLAMHSFDVINAATEIVQGTFGSVFTLKARQFEKETYSVLVLLNPTDAVKAVTNKGNVKTQFEAVANADVRALVSSNGIFMCNAYGYVPTTEANWKSTQAEAEAAGVPVEVKVERSVAKVFVAPAAGTVIDAPGASLAKMVHFGMDIINKKMYWMRKPNQALSGQGTENTEAPTANETSGTPRYNQYAIDPNMGFFPMQDAAHFWYYNADNAFATSTGGWTDEKGIYIPENTTDATNQRGLSTTRALINVQYLPKSLTFTSTTDKTWANYKGTLMTLDQLNEKATASETAVNDAAIYMPNGFKADMKALKDKGIVFGPDTPSFDEHNLKFYHNGENYYATYIRHFDNMKQPMKMAYGRYGVLRNHVYKVQVTKITGAGTPIPPPPTDEPNDKDETFIKVKVTVAPWNVREQRLDLD